MSRAEVRAQILGCESCDLVKRCTAPVPFDGSESATLAVVGEAPGQQEDVSGRPFVGPAGTYLRDLLTEYELDDVFFMNAASCFPVDADGKGRAPNNKELQACRANLDAQLKLSEASYLLLAGSVALKAFQPKLKITQARGRPFLLGGSRTEIGNRVCVPTFHPSYVLRMGGPETKADRLVREDVSLLTRLMHTGRDGWMREFPDTCVLCDEYATKYTEDGLGWCEGHGEQ